MCGRFTIVATAKQIRERYRIGESGTDLFDPRYNAAPGMLLPIISGIDSPDLIMALWGLILPWSSAKKGIKKLVNSRVETVREKKTFRKLIQKNRCIIPVTGFFEWSSPEKGHIPYLFRMKDRTIFSLAGLWNEWFDTEKGGSVITFSIITTEAGEIVKPVHDRMPLIIHPEYEEPWLNGRLSVDSIDSIKDEMDLMEVYRVGTTINSPSVNDPSVLIPQ